MSKDSYYLAYFILIYYFTIKLLVQLKLLKDCLFDIVHHLQIIHLIIVEHKYKPANCLQRMREELMQRSSQSQQIIYPQIHPQLNNLPKVI